MNATYTTDSQNIIDILLLLGATSKETAVYTKDIVAKGIELGLTEDIDTEEWHGYENSDHPYWFILAAMCGEGNWEDVEEYDEPYLHRFKVDYVNEETGKKSKRYAYYYDTSTTHTRQVRCAKVEKYLKHKVFKDNSNTAKIYACTDNELKTTIDVFMKKNNIGYLLETMGNHNILTVQVTEDIFFRMPIQKETAETVIRKIPYCVLKPRYASDEIPGVIKVKDAKLGKQWKTLTAEN